MERIDHRLHFVLKVFKILLHKFILVGPCVKIFIFKKRFISGISLREEMENSLGAVHLLNSPAIVFVFDLNIGQTR